MIDELPREFEPITHAIPNFYNHKKATNLFEANVLNGKLLICSMDILNDLENRYPAKQLKNSIMHYVNSDEFNPAFTLSINDLEKLFATNTEVKDEEIDLALNKKAYADSEKSHSYNASKGNDGNPTTSLYAGDSEVGHFWVVDLGDIYEISGTKITFSEKANYLYAIHTSVDGKNFKMAVNQTGQTKDDQIRYDEFNDKCRYVKVLYNGLPKGIWASHIEVKVYKK